ncbi:hypothetical protein MD484_g1573, partial [Candolleomyces efflorescens]
MRRHIALCLSFLTLSIPSGLSGPTPPPYRTQIERYDGQTTGRYIVTLKDGVSRQAVINQLADVANDAVEVVSDWDNVLNGFSAKLDESALSLLQTLPGVECIAQDGIMHTAAMTTQHDAPWGLSRLSSDSRLTGAADQLNFQYTYDDSSGAGVDIYVIDTGVKITHQDFGGRAEWGATFGGYPDQDGHGHGTHVAATAAGNKYGVSKKAKIIAVKVLSDQGSGSITDIISGINFVAMKCAASARPCVINMSLGGSKSCPLDLATRAATLKGVHVVVAAGNSNQDAATTSPASVKEAITVGASNITDYRAFFSNYGRIVDIFAPGQSITSAWIDNDNATKTISGTSMASPHVAGLVAYLIAFNGTLDSPADMQNKVKDFGIRNALSNIPATMLRYIQAYLPILALFAHSVLSGPTPPPYRTEIEPYDGEITGLHIVTLKKDVLREEVIAQLINLGPNAVEIVHEYGHVLNGFAAELDDIALAHLQTSPAVETITEDGIMHVTAAVQQNEAPWGLARLSTDGWSKEQNSSQRHFKYTYDDSAGSGVDIYIVDTGVRIDHTEFGNRARWGKTFGECYYDEDDNGHGSHVAGIAAGATYGVAKAANIIAVKVLDHDGSGLISDIIAGLDWVSGQSTTTNRPSVVNMSLGGSNSTSLDDATKKLIENGVHVVAAAGNSNKDAIDISPAHVSGVITVGASTIDDKRAWFSNYGSVVDVFAPGEYIISAWNKTATDTNTISGTSMASPHVAGLVAYLIELEGNIDPEQMQTKVKELGEKNALSDLPAGTTNILAHNTLVRKA